MEDNPYVSPEQGPETERPLTPDRTALKAFVPLVRAVGLIALLMGAESLFWAVCQSVGWSEVYYPTREYFLAGIARFVAGVTLLFAAPAIAWLFCGDAEL